MPLASGCERRAGSERQQPAVRRSASGEPQQFLWLVVGFLRIQRLVGKRNKLEFCNPSLQRHERDQRILRLNRDRDDFPEDSPLYRIQCLARCRSGRRDDRRRRRIETDKAPTAALASDRLATEIDPRRAVAINARAALRRRIGGVERYAREMVRRMPSLDSSRYSVLRPHRSLAHGFGHLWEQVVLPIEARRFGLLYSPANTAPARAHNNLVVIHDAAVLRYPEAYSRSYVAFHSRLLRTIAERAKLVITVSEFSRGELSELLRLPLERFSVVPCGVAESFSGVLPDEHVRQKYGLMRPYVLCVATLSARKNLNVLEAASRVLHEVQIDLVLAGAGRRYMREQGSPIRQLGYVPDSELAALYAGARAFVMPSLYEGFGLPCVEAMACGVPVIAARAGALPETVGDAGLLVDPRDPDQFAEAVSTLVHDQSLRARLIEKGKVRAKLFSWENTAVRTDEVVSALI